MAYIPILLIVSNGVDFELQRQAMERATALLVEICGGEVGDICEVASDAFYRN